MELLVGRLQASLYDICLVYDNDTHKYRNASSFLILVSLASVFFFFFFFWGLCALGVWVWLVSVFPLSFFFAFFFLSFFLFFSLFSLCFFSLSSPSPLKPKGDL
jgi:hypothetical protein